MEVDITKKVTRLFRYGILGLALFAVLAAGGVYVYQHHHRYMTVHDAEVMSQSVGVKAQADGTVLELFVEDGAQVDAGTPIARIKPNVTEEEVEQLQQTVALAERNLKEAQQGQTLSIPSAASTGASAAAQQNLANAEARMQRMNELFEMGAISAVKRDEAAAEYEAAKAAASSASASGVQYQTVTQKASPEMIKNAEIQLRQAKAALESAQQAMKETEIVAPVSGTVSLGELAVGAAIKGGATIASIGDASAIWVAAQIPADQKSAVHLGQFVSYELDGTQMQGTVQEIADAGDASQGEGETDSDMPQMATVKISVPSDAAPSIRPGTAAIVKFPLP